VKLRWLMVHPGPSWSVHDVHVGWAEALRELGQDVHEFRLDDRLAFYDKAMVEDGPANENGVHQFRKMVTTDQASALAIRGLPGELWRLRPDVLFLINGAFVPAEILEHARRAYGTRVVTIHTEEPYETDRALRLAGHSDLNLITDPTNLQQFLDVAPTVFAPHCYRPAVHHPGPGRTDLRSDLAFVGTGFGSRRWFLEELARAGHLQGLDVLLAGNWQGLRPDSPIRPFVAADAPEDCCDNELTADIYRAARMSLNLYRRDALTDGGHAAGQAMGPREVEMAACGLFFLRDPRPEGDEVFPMLPRFTDPDSAGELIQWWLAHDDERRTAAGQAYAAIADRTFKGSAQKLLRLFDRAPTQN